MLTDKEDFLKRAKLVELLLDHGANPYDSCYYGRDAFFHAINQENFIFSRPLHGLCQEMERLTKLDEKRAVFLLKTVALASPPECPDAS
jgi:hypothetical protein